MINWYLRNALTRRMVTRIFPSMQKTSVLRLVNPTMYKKAQVKASKCFRLLRRKLVLGSLEVFLVIRLTFKLPLWILCLGSIPERDVKDGRVYNTCTVYNPKGALPYIYFWIWLNKKYQGELVAMHRKIHLFDIDIPGKIKFKVGTWNFSVNCLICGVSGERNADRRDHPQLIWYW